MDVNEFTFGRVARAVPLETFLGSPDDEVEIWTSRSDGECGVEFKTNQVYLIVGRQNSRDGTWSTNICDRTRIVDESIPEFPDPDLKALRAWKNGQPLDRWIYGSVRDDTNLTHWYIPPRPVPGLSIKIKAGKFVAETVTDESGLYIITGLPPRRYEVFVDSQVKEIVPWTPGRVEKRIVDLTKDHCSNTSFRVRDKR